VREIGRTLREAREARGLTFETVEDRTKIRARYLVALEAERFDELPGEAYARGFLRTYADAVGLDGQEVLAALRARQRAHEEPPVAPRAQRPYEPLRLGPAVAGLVTAVALVVFSLAAWQLGDGRRDRPAASPPPAQQPPAQQQPAAAPGAVAVSSRGATSLQVRLGGPNGRRVWSGTVRPGQELRFGLRRPLWLRAGRPERLRLSVAGTPTRLPAGVATLVVTRRGVRPA
jgi:cytoskeletal protein RodZ